MTRTGKNIWYELDENQFKIYTKFRKYLDQKGLRITKVLPELSAKVMENILNGKEKLSNYIAVDY